MIETTYFDIEEIHTKMIQQKSDEFYVGMTTEDDEDICLVFRLEHVKEIADYYYQCLKDGTNIDK